MNKFTDDKRRESEEFSLDSVFFFEKFVKA